MRYGSHDIHLFPINNPSLDSDEYLNIGPCQLTRTDIQIFVTGTATTVACLKTPPQTELQIPATVTTLTVIETQKSKAVTGN